MFGGDNMKKSYYTPEICIFNFRVVDMINLSVVTSATKTGGLKQVSLTDLHR